MSKEVKYYEFSRGDKYKVVVAAVDAERFVIAELSVPPGTSEELKDKFLTEAEHAVNTFIAKYETA